MNRPDLNVILQKLHSHTGHQPQPNGKGWKCRCPAHRDRNPSLQVWEDCDGKPALKCHAGCSTKDVVEEIGFTMKQLYGNSSSRNGQCSKGTNRPPNDSSGKKEFATWEQAVTGYGKGQPSHVWHYHNLAGDIVGVIARWDTSDGKVIRPVALIDGTWQLTGMPSPGSLYRLPDLAGAKRVYVCEGEKAADAVRSCGLIATTSPHGAKSAAKADWTPLAGKDVVLLPDNDGSGEGYIAEVINQASTLDRQPTVRLVELPDLPPSGDAADYVELMDALDFDALRENFEAMADAAPLVDLKPKTRSDNAKRSKARAETNPSVATRAIQMLEAMKVELWHTSAGDAFVAIQRDGRIEHWPIRSREFKGWLTGEFYKSFGQAMNSEAISSAINVIIAKATVDGEEHEVFVRVARHAGKTYVDLCNQNWQAVEIAADGWRVVDKPPVRFRRFKAMLPLPIPTRGGRIDELRQLINVTDATWPLVVGWLLGCYLPDCKYPILALFAEQGAGKTTAARLLRALIDPNISPLRSEPRNVDDLIIAANNSWLVAFDNLSSIAAWFSDGLCRLATGGGVSKRTLYTDSEETIFSLTRPAMLTSIEDVANRSDLLDRCLVAHLPSIPSHQRRTESELLQSFDAIRPRLIGALLDAVTMGLQNLPTVTPSNLPRMADFAKWVIACEPALGWPLGTFLARYDDNRNEANELALESSVIWKPLSELLVERNEWRGTAGELKKTLEDRLNSNPPKDWPKTPKAVGGAVRRIAPNVRASGWTVSFDEREPHGQRRKIIVIDKALPSTCPMSPTRPIPPD